MNNSSSSSSSSWIYQTDQICPSCSIILGHDTPTFFAIHSVAIVLLTVSILSCFSVLISIWLDCRASLTSLCDQSSRFPFFIATTDAIWCISNLCDHIYLVTNKTCPSEGVINVMGAVMTFGLGYQQLMHAGLAVDMYFKICKNYAIRAGLGEWKLHAFTWAMITAMVTVSIYTGAFGCSGFWIYNNVQTQSGHMLAAFSALLGATLCFATSASYISIKRMVDRHELENEGAVIHNDFHATATHCLTTYIAMCFLVYCPLSIAYLAFLLETAYFKVIETTTALVVVVSANSLGWANAFVYFYNKKVKLRRNGDNNNVLEDGDVSRKRGVTTSPCRLKRCMFSRGNVGGGTRGRLSVATINSTIGEDNDDDHGRTTWYETTAF